MIPISITLKGIYSYREEQSIDFTRLTEANIFGIFGAVGSGKSTILEAISFAIYGETERLNQRDNRTYNMMNLKSDELLIDFIFKTGEKDGEYRFIVEGKRSKMNFDKVGSYQRRAYKKVKGVWEPVESESAEKIIGLSYDNFRRTIIIPQNQFQEFLQLGDKERTQMMKELFDLEKFELDGKVKVLERRNEDARITLDGQLSQIGIIPPEEIEKKEKELEALNSTIEKSNKIFEERQKKEIEYKGLRKLFENIELQKKSVSGLEASEPGIKSLEKQVKEYEQCSVNFKGALENRKELSTRIVNQKNELESQNTSYRINQELLIKKEREFKTSKTAYDNREQLKEKSIELNKISQIIELETKAIEIGVRIEKGEKHIKDILYAIGTQTIQQKARKEELINFKKQEPDSAVLTEVSNWFTIKNNLHGNIKRLRNEQKIAEGEVESGLLRQNEFFAQAAKRTSLKLVKNITDEDALNDLATCKAELKKEIRSIEETLKHLAAQDKLEEYATALKKGENCPLCGSEEHPHLLNITDVKKAISKGDKSRLDCDGKVERIDRLVQEIKTNSKDLEKSRTALLKIKRSLEGEQNILDKHLGKFKWKGFNKEDEGQLTKAFSDAKRIKQQISGTDKDLEILDKEITASNKQKEISDELLKTLKQNVSAKNATISTLKKQIKILEYNNFKKIKTTDLKDNILVLNNQYREIEKNYLQLDKFLVDLRAKQNQLKGNLDTGTRTLASFEKSMNTQDTTLRQQLKSSGYTSVEIVESILKLNLNITAEKKKIDQFRQNLHTAKQQLKVFSDQTKNKSYDAKAHSNLISEIAQIKGGIDQLRNEQGSISNQIKQLKKDLASFQKLQKELEIVKLRAIDIAVLKNLFKASGFVSYVSYVYLQTLCNAANDRFLKLTKQRLKLELDEKNNFLVRDFMNDGQVRLAKTLSGGQTFQAALCLALALADSIQKLTRSNQNFFFLDEGFGSLDKESLAVAFDTLKTLRKENRIVGVISHVEEMQQEIDVFLKITNEEARGSILTTSWTNS
jgi:exonuclease SbcC